MYSLTFRLRVMLP